MPSLAPPYISIGSQAQGYGAATQPSYGAGAYPAAGYSSAAAPSSVQTTAWQPPLPSYAAPATTQVCHRHCMAAEFGLATRRQADWKAMLQAQDLQCLCMRS